jgi:polyhydroxyalkanoate synthase subunit PhaC
MPASRNTGASTDWMMSALTRVSAGSESSAEDMHQGGCHCERRHPKSVFMEDDTKAPGAIPTLEDWQHWTWVMGRAQQMMMEAWAQSLKTPQPWPAVPPAWGAFPPAFVAPGPASAADPASMMAAGAEAWAKGLDAWGAMLGLDTKPGEKKDRRFSAPEWRDNPLFDQIRQTYLALSDKMLGTVEQIEGLDDESRARLRFATRSFVDCDEPVQFRADQSEVLKKTIETRGENLLNGLANMLKDIAAGQLTQTRPGAFEVGRNLATTPGKVIRETELYQLIQYTPTTDEVLETPVSSSRRGSTASTSSTSPLRKASSNGASTTAFRCSWSAGSRRTRASPT